MDSEGIKTEKAGKNTSQSIKVAGTGLEPVTSGL